MPELEVQPGAVLAGKYRVERVLGKGGMGVVVEATQAGLERRVALKFLRHAQLRDAAQALTRFEREARTVAKLRGSHIVQVYDVGRLEHGEPFIVMELLEGEDLKAVLDRQGRLLVSQAVEYVAQVCEAMAEAHVAGVVHRDLKPANLFVARAADGRPMIKVLDFGISKLMTETTSLNLTSGALGSPLYMSPEQLTASNSVSFKTDIWSLGTVLYELLTGADAFAGAGLEQICARIVAGRPEPMSGPGLELPPGLEAAVLRCLCRDPAERFATVADLAMALMPFAKKGAVRSIEAAVRIVQASPMGHPGLPQAFDSTPPGPLANQTQPLAHAKTLAAAPPFTVKAAESTAADTIDIGAAVAVPSAAMAHTVPAAGVSAVQVAFDKTLEAAPPTLAAAQTGSAPARTAAAATSQAPRTAPRLKPLVFENTLLAAGVTRPVRPGLPGAPPPSLSRLLPILLAVAALVAVGGVLLAVQFARGDGRPADSPAAAAAAAEKAPLAATEPAPGSPPVVSMTAAAAAAPLAAAKPTPDTGPAAAPEPNPSSATATASSGAPVSKAAPVVRKPRAPKAPDPSADDMLKHR